MHRLTTGIRTLAHAAVNFVYPPSCPLCGGETDQGAADVTLEPVFCSDCRNTVAPHIENSCGICGAPVGPYLDAAEGCIHCRTDNFRFERVYCLGVYDDVLKHACLRAKTPQGRPLATALAALLWDCQGEAIQLEGIDLVVAVPRHWLRRLTAGSGAAETLAETLASRLQVEFVRPILAKVRRTPAQSTLPPYRRRSNLRRAFRVKDSRPLKGATVLLVDDVLTTGTTANEVSRALLSSGANRVFVAVPARGIGR
jgi:predicted amidophosphoribosyltransferase